MSDSVDKMNDKGETSGKLHVIRWRTWLMAAIILLLGLLLGQGGLAALVLIWQILVGVPRWLLSRDPALKAFRLRRMAIYLAAAIWALAFMAVDIKLAEHRAEKVAQALHAFHDRHGHYPAQLEELVPETLPELPRSRLALVVDSYYYRAGEEGKPPRFAYTVVAPFGRMMYDFEARRWNALD